MWTLTAVVSQAFTCFKCLSSLSIVEYLFLQPTPHGYLLRHRWALCSRAVWMYWDDQKVFNLAGEIVVAWRRLGILHVSFRLWWQVIFVLILQIEIRNFWTVFHQRRHVNSAGKTWADVRPGLMTPCGIFNDSSRSILFLKGFCEFGMSPLTVFPYQQRILNSK